MELRNIICRKVLTLTLREKTHRRTDKHDKCFQCNTVPKSLSWYSSCDIICVILFFFFPLQLLFTFFALINTLRIMFDMRADSHLGLHVTCPLLFTDKLKLKLLRNFRWTYRLFLKIKLSNAYFLWAKCRVFNCKVGGTYSFIFSNSGGVESNWVHSTLRPPIGLLYQPRVITMVKKLVESWLAG
jgi:hypothetical protein